MSEYTKGPWVADVSINDRGGWESPTQCVVIGNGENIVAMYETNYAEYPDDEQNVANARLISSAPELLEACQTFAEWLRREDEGLPSGIERGTPEGERQWRIWWDENLRICDLAQTQVRAALAKATAEPQ